MEKKLKTCAVSALLVLTPYFGVVSQKTLNLGVGFTPLVLFHFPQENAVQGTTAPKSIDVVVRDPQLEALIDKIAFCESGHREDVEIIDSNGYYSRGVMQWQMRTFQYALEDLGYAAGDHETLRSQMLDGEFAKQIAYEWIDKDFDNVYHWSCYRKVV